MIEVLKSLSEAEANVVWNALAQFVENGRDAIDGGSSEELPQGASTELEVAEGLLQRLDLAKSQLRIVYDPRDPNGCKCDSITGEHRKPDGWLYCGKCKRRIC